MQNLSDLSTVQEVDDFINEQICRDLPPKFRARIEAGECTAEERAADPKIDAVCKALGRRTELEQEVHT